MKSRVIALMCALLFVPAAAADVLVMKNGSRLVGKLLGASDGQIEFDTPFAGKIKIKEENVDVISTDDNATVMMEDGEIYRDLKVTATEDTLVMQRENQPARSYDIDQIKYINPPAWRLGEGFNFTGRTNAAMEAERGNSDSDEASGDYWMEVRSLRNRFTFRGDINYEKANNEKVTDNWEVRNKYDRFFSADDMDNYYGAKLRYEYDRFADLDLRTVVGPHLGREFFDNELLQLRGEIGPVYVKEDFDAADDRDYYAALWELEAESGWLGFGTTLYLLTDGTLNFSHPDEPLINTTVGLRMPLIFGFETSVEAKWEYNGGAPDDVDTTDETYRFKIGYAW